MALDFRFKPQHGPARFGIEETGIGDPNLADARHVQTGVIDKSGAVITAAVGQTIEDTGRVAIAGEQYRQQREKGKALSELQTSLQENIQSYSESQGNPQLVQESLITAAQSRESETALTAQWFQGVPGIEMKNIQAVRDTHAKALATLTKAQAQGHMSIQQFQDRTLAITREHINRNPALLGELLAHSKQVLGITGMDDIIAAQGRSENAVAKLEEQRDAVITSNAKEFNEPMQYIPGTSIIDRQTMEPLLAKAMFAKQALATAQTEVQMNTAKEKSDGVAFARYGIPAVREGFQRETLKALQEINNSGENPQQKMNMMRSVINGSRDGFRNTPRVAQFSNVDEVKYHIETHEKNMDVLSKIFASDLTQEDAQKYLENQASMLSNQEKIGVMQHVNVLQTEILSKMELNYPSLLTGNKENRENFIARYRSLASIGMGKKNSFDTNYSIKSPTGSNAAIDFMDTAVKESGKGNQAGTDTLNTAIDTFYSDRNTEKFPTTEDRYLFDDKFIEMVGKSGNKEGIKNLNTNARDKALILLDEHMTLTVGNLDKDLSNARRQGGIVELRTIPDGRLTLFTSGNVNSQEVDRIRGRYINRINSSIMAVSNIYGSGSKEAAQHLFSQYEPLKGLALQKEGETKGQVTPTIKGETVNPPIEKKRETMSSLEQTHKLPSGLLEAVMQVESGGKPGQVSKAGAKGYFQFMDDTAKQYQVNVNDFNSEAQGAAKFLSDLNRQYKGDMPRILAAYNWGQGNVAKKGMENMPKETREYIDKVLSKLYG